MKYKKIAATLLLGLAFAFPGASVSAVEPVSVVPAIQNSFLANDISKEIITILLERYAAPHWKLSTVQVWDLFLSGQITVIEMSPWKYELRYSGDVLTVVLNDGF